MDQNVNSPVPLKILHLEDSPQDAELIHELLVDSGIDVSIDCVATGKEFVSLLLSRKFDIILADFKLPGFDAFGALQRSLEICPDVPFICISGTIGEEAAVELIRQGAVDYILKDRLNRLPFAITRALDDAKEKELLHHAEAMLRESESRYRTMIENSNDLIQSVDLDGRFLFVNPNWRHTLGYSEDEITDLSLFDVIHPDFHLHCREMFEKILNGIAVPYIEVTFVAKDGRLIFLVGNAAPRFLEGKVIATQSFFHDITERKRAEEQIKKDLKEKEVLLKELYHRTKNNMQVICSLIRLQSLKTKDKKAKELFKEIETRIYSMALVHQKLLGSTDLSHLNLKDYFDSLLIHLQLSYVESMKDITIHTEMVDVTALIDTAVPLGLVFNELIANIVKHAFPDKKRGRIQVKLYQSPQNKIVLEVSDNGTGFPKGFNLKKDIHFGLETAIDLVEQQLGGKIDFKSRNGLHCRIVMKEELYKPRI